MHPTVYIKNIMQSRNYHECWYKFLFYTGVFDC